MTDYQKKFIEKNCKKMTIREMATALNIGSPMIRSYVYDRQLDYKMVYNKRVISFKKGCFNPNEEDNWLV